LASRTSAVLLLYVDAEKGRHRFCRGAPRDAYQRKDTRENRRRAVR